MADRDDDELILALREPGTRREACTALYQRYGHRFLNYLRRRGESPTSAEDLVQEAFIRLIRRADSFEAQGHGRAWIWTVAQSCWKDEWKRSHWPQQAWDASAAAELMVDGNWTQRQDFQDCIQGQLARFDQAHPAASQALVWAAVDGFSGTELAALLGRSPGATRQFLSDCRRKLRPFVELCFDLLGV